MNMLGNLIIEENKKLYFTNMAVYQAKMRPENVGSNLMNFLNDLHWAGCKKDGPLITANIGYGRSGDEDLIEMKIMTPITNSSCLPSPYLLVPEFCLDNLWYHRYVGDPQKIQEIFSQIINFIEDKKLTYGAIYNVHYQDELSKDPSQKTAVDIYIEILN
jgi:hypothetical protein